MKTNQGRTQFLDTDGDDHQLFFFIWPNSRLVRLVDTAEEDLCYRVIILHSEHFSTFNLYLCDHDKLLFITVSTI